MIVLPLEFSYFQPNSVAILVMGVFKTSLYKIVLVNTKGSLSSLHKMGRTLGYFRVPGKNKVYPPFILSPQRLVAQVVQRGPALGKQKMTLFKCSKPMQQY